MEILGALDTPPGVCVSLGNSVLSAFILPDLSCFLIVICIYVRYVDNVQPRFGYTWVILLATKQSRPCVRPYAIYPDFLGISFRYFLNKLAIYVIRYLNVIIIGLFRD